MRFGQNRPVFYGWWVVSTAAVLFWGPPVTVFSFSVFFKPLMQDFHASRAAVSLGYTPHSIAGAISAPLVGWVIDRCGARKVIPVAAMPYPVSTQFMGKAYQWLRWREWNWRRH